MAERKTVVRSIEEAAEEGGLYFAGGQSNLSFIKSGSTLLDCTLGGGWAIGRISNIVGDKSTGKTLLAMEALANFVKDYPDGTAFYAEIEAAFDKSYAAALGIPVDKIIFKEGMYTVEDLYKDLEDIIEQMEKQKADTPVLYVLDSLDALSDAAELDRDIDKGSFGAQKAKKMSEMFRKLNQLLSEKKFHLMIISQVRENIGVTFGRKYSRSGGMALDFYASQVIYLAKIKNHVKTKNKIERVTGVRVKSKCDKNKVSLPFRDCEFDIMFGYGIDDLNANIEWLDSIGRLSEFTGQQDTAKTYISRLEKMKDDDFFDEFARAEEFVKTVWQDIEKGFLPTRKKRRG